MRAKDGRKVLCILSTLVLIAGCTGYIGRRPILVGLVVELTGAQGTLGVEARDGAQLAVDAINDGGGVDGRPIELIVGNDKGDPSTARQIDTELVQQGVVAIIGHATSGQTAAVFDQINADKVVLISPGASSNQFSGQKDYFFRVVSSTDILGEALAAHMYIVSGARHLTCIYDTQNRAYAEPLWQSIQNRFGALGGSTAQVFTFASGETDLQSLMAQVTATDPETVVFIASGVDTALMIQYGKQYGLEAQLFSSAWAQTNELLEKGGQAVNGLEMVAGYYPRDPSPAFQQFAARFEARYGRMPGLMASYAYEAVLMLAHALEQTEGKATGLPDALASIRDWPGVQGLISMDEYGDVRRDVYVAIVRDGQFEVSDVISPAE